MTHYDVHGISVPALGLGTYRLEGDAAREAVEHALSIGYRHVDTAQIYENEEAVGAGLAAASVPRADVFLTTKVWRDRLTRDRLAPSVDESLRKLGTDYVDLLLVHWPNEGVPLEETLPALDAVRQAGKARLIGVSNFPPGLLRRALEIVPDLATDQVEHHPHLGQPDLLEVVRGHGMVLTAYSPVGQGQALKDETVRDVAEAKGVGPATVALAWLLGQDRVVAIPKAASPGHREANLAAAEVTLTDEERARIDALPKDGRIVDPGFAPDWDA
jgi:2,5-diketo-D-gluconate reductase B